MLWPAVCTQKTAYQKFMWFNIIQRKGHARKQLVSASAQNRHFQNDIINNEGNDEVFWAEISQILGMPETFIIYCKKGHNMTPLMHYVRSPDDMREKIFYELFLWIYQTLLSKATFSTFRLYIVCQNVCSLEIEPTTSALLTQCSTTEPQEQEFGINRNRN